MLLSMCLTIDNEYNILIKKDEKSVTNFDGGLKYLSISVTLFGAI